MSDPLTVFKFDPSTFTNSESNNLHSFTLKPSVADLGRPENALMSPKLESTARISPQLAHASAKAPAKECFCCAHKECMLAHAKILGINTESDEYDIVKQLLTLEPQLQEDESLAEAAFRVKSPFSSSVIPSTESIMQATYRQLQDYAMTQVPHIKANSKTETIRRELIERRMYLLIKYIVEQDSWKVKHADHLSKIATQEQQPVENGDSVASIGKLGPNESNGSKHLTEFQESLEPPSTAMNGLGFDDTKQPPTLQSTSLVSKPTPRILPHCATTKPYNNISSISPEHPPQELSASCAKNPSSQSTQLNSERACERSDSELGDKELPTKDSNAIKISVLRSSNIPKVPFEGLTSIACKGRHLATGDLCSNAQDDLSRPGVLLEMPSPGPFADSDKAHYRTSISACNGNSATPDIKQPSPGLSSGVHPVRLGSVQQTDHHTPVYRTEGQEMVAVLDKFVELRKLDMEERVKRDVIICFGMLLCMILARITA